MSKFPHIGGAIKARRIGLGLTQADLCARLGWSAGRFGDISRIENNKISNITLENLKAFARALSCHPADLVLMLKTEDEQESAV